MFIDHISMYSDNPEQTKDFYEKYFDAESNDGVVNGEDRSYFLSFGGGGTAKLEIVENREDLKKLRRNHIDHGFMRLAFMVDSEDEVDKKIEELKKDGYQVLKEPDKNEDGYYTGVILDPGDNQVEVIYGAPGGSHCPVDKQRSK